MLSEHTPHNINLSESQSDSGRQLESIVADPEPDDARLTWQEHQAIGDQAYAEAVTREEKYGLDEITVARYKAASKNLLSVTATGPLLNGGKISSEAEPADPIRLMKIAGSLAKQAQAADKDETYDTYGSDHINVKSNKRRIAVETYQRASRLMMGEENYENYAAMMAEFDGESPTEVVATAVVEAARETGTAEYVYGPEAVEDDTLERLEAGGEDAVVRFIGEHALESGPQGLEFVARAAEITVEAVEEITGEHTLPVTP